MNSDAVSTRPMENSAGPSIGQDLWRQLKRVQIPFSQGTRELTQVGELRLSRV